MPRGEFPVYAIGGDARTRGAQCGELAREHIAVSVQSYRRLFQYYAGQEWGEVLGKAANFVPAVEAYDTEIMEEIRGIAEGSGRSVEEIMAINVRTELMYGVSPPPTECTAIVALPFATADGHVLVGQNWDWHPSQKEAFIILKVRQEGRPNVVILTEAGLVGKMGMTASGLGLCVTLLVCDQDRCAWKVPMHILLRGMASAETMGDAIAAVSNADRSSSANFVIAHEAGEAIDLEAAPDDYDYVDPEDGVLIHTNHFTSQRLPVKDRQKAEAPNTLIRMQRAEKVVRPRIGEITVETFKEAFRDHFNYPESVCRHPDPRDDEPLHRESVASVIMDLTEKRMLVSCGPPCANPYKEYSFKDFLAEDS